LHTQTQRYLTLLLLAKHARDKLQRERNNYHIFLYKPVQYYDGRKKNYQKFDLFVSARCALISGRVRHLILLRDDTSDAALFIQMLPY